MWDETEIRTRSRRILLDHWDPERGHTCPHPATYPHQWLWDSCFAAICWTRLGEPDKGLRELGTVLSSQFPDGFVPHMRYAHPVEICGPLPGTSSFTQPPVYAHTAHVLAEIGPVPAALLGRIGRALEWLWARRRTPDGLLFLVHPWESGADDSPRWDSWIAARQHADDWRSLRWNRPEWTAFDHDLVQATRFGECGQAVGSTVFACAPAAFNAIAAHAAAQFAELAGDGSWHRRSQELATAMDAQLWDQAQGLWSDAPIVGGGASVHVPTLDGVLGALVTADPDKATRALDQLLDGERFAAPYGLAYVARDHVSYDPDGYWRGGAWMQMNYLAALAARRWTRVDIADAIATMARGAVERSGFAEYWNPETGAGLGAIPLTWSALVVAL